MMQIQITGFINQLLNVNEYYNEMDACDQYIGMPLIKTAAAWSISKIRVCSDLTYTDTPGLSLIGPVTVRTIYHLYSAYRRATF